MKAKLTVKTIESNNSELTGNYCLMDWNDRGARCSSNIAGMNCPRCGTALTAQEHVCGRPPKQKPEVKRA